MTDNLVIRAAIESDLDQLLELSTMVGSGMTSMPSDRQSWITKLERSIADFNDPEPKRRGDIYFMVMEDLENNTIVGSGAVYTGIGLEQPFYSYKLATITSTSEKLNLTVHTRVLNLVNDFTGATEIGSLFLLPEYRRDGIGKFLSRSRFLLLADFPKRFDEVVFAEMRGWLDPNDCSPFWDSLGHKFFGLSFQKADFISAVDGFQFISDLMPKYPVYVDLLSGAAQNAIGKPHRDAAGAFRILQKEGFRYTGYVDIFDGGPSVKTQLDQIRTVQDSATATVEKIVDASELTDASNYIVSNARLPDYRMTRTAIYRDEAGNVTLSSAAANALQVTTGDKLRTVLEFREDPE
jgi:arginine N-succinyltransferase